MRKLIQMSVMALVCMSAQSVDEKELAMTKCSKPAIETGVPVRERKVDCEMQCPIEQQGKPQAKRIGAAKKVTGGQ